MAGFVCRTGSRDAAESISAELTGDGFRIFIVEGRKVSNAVALYEAFERAGVLTPITPAAKLNWDGFQDELWDALAYAALGPDGRAHNPVAVLWLDADVACAASLSLVLNVIEVFVSTTAAIRAGVAPQNVKLEFRLYLLGKGAGFDGEALPCSCNPLTAFSPPDY